jgi:hypothetical protein
MNYKEMLDKFDYLERQLAHLENENKHVKERLARLEYPQLATVKGPSFTPGTLPGVGLNTWYSTTTAELSGTQGTYKPQRNYGAEGQEFQ